MKSWKELTERKALIDKIKLQINAEIDIDGKGLNLELFEEDDKSFIFISQAYGEVNYFRVTKDDYSVYLFDKAPYNKHLAIERFETVLEFED